MDQPITKDILFYKIVPLLSYYDLYCVQFLNRDFRLYANQKFRCFFEQKIGLAKYKRNQTVQFCAYYLFVFDSGYRIAHLEEGYQSFMTASDAFTHLYLKNELNIIRQVMRDQDDSQPLSISDFSRYNNWKLSSVHFNNGDGYYVMPLPIKSNRHLLIYPILTLLCKWICEFGSVSIMNNRRGFNQQHVFKQHQNDVIIHCTMRSMM